jgi:hypothetical protein
MLRIQITEIPDDQATGGLDGAAIQATGPQVMILISRAQLMDDDVWKNIYRDTSLKELDYLRTHPST